MITVAALFVEPKGSYSGQLGVELWGKERDARLYPGPFPVVAHPPCERWGNYWFGGPSSPKRYKLGDDGGCFASALRSVRAYTGVLEHPASSRAWKAFGLVHPPREGGWVLAGDGVGYTCRVEQGHYGHAARKATWLYACGIRELPELVWGPSLGLMLERGKGKSGNGALERLSKKQRASTPPAFRDVLLAIARQTH